MAASLRSSSRNTVSSDAKKRSTAAARFRAHEDREYIDGLPVGCAIGTR